ncbi:hypothetical protein [Pseudarthrobacter sp. NamE5]|uniref:hypothetical protein n=1 Tax=Pseudarthrobacter sp. NamE5 TaxID=2576839 RepID=UPI00110A2351|nr:hypothetical protein [Pseudarthrobacter sp. NamE5]TLM80933.1 hypothetical protein FDW84_19095 [Pseudarthrobacter sp. NamE5]
MPAHDHSDELDANPLRSIEDGGHGFCYDIDRSVFPGASASTHGPLLVGLDTNAVLEIQEYGVRLIDDVRIHHPDAEHLRDIYALGDLVQLWFVRDIRFVVLPGARRDQRRPGKSEKIARLHETLSAIEEALTFQIQDWGYEDHRFDWARTRNLGVDCALARIPGSLDRRLVEQSYDAGVDVFLTMDKQVLRSVSTLPSGFPNLWRPPRLWLICLD